ncbi:hypothetical protein BCR36DRAFT_584760 [Piromyces finnis]|uniref:Uncharacterized protein n=1 Tax=Piromyces finnis TaxID=1754191 RepID=A0A1Y1V6L6_9FUNG|nr:hypothetical protein BCR36DRAFT_584760 [Piromyces finnis]|eukprot:ORX47658.1 hypothetical protein BCR36DRAFT_584760 [Piromyces finnis]
MKSAYIITLLLIQVAYIFGQATNIPYITEPVQTSKWAFGKSQTCMWKPNGQSGPKTLELFFLNGAAPNTFQGAPIYTTSVPDIAAGKAVVDLSGIDTSKYPPSSSTYYIRIGESYSSQFTITGGTGSAVSAGPTTGAATGPATGATGATGPNTGSSFGTGGSSNVVPVSGTGVGSTPISKVTVTKTLTSTIKANSTSDAKATLTYSVFAIIATIMVVFM